MKGNRFSVILIILLIILGINFSFSQNAQNVNNVHRVGTTAAQFLKIAAGARPVGMGGAYSALATDILAVYWNPAGLSRVVGTGEAIFNHSSWLAETNYDFAAFSVNLRNMGSVGFSLISLRTPQQPVRTVEHPEGTGQMWDANMISLAVTYARNLTDRFSIGFTGKFVQERIFQAIARGAAFDLGILYQTPIESITLGAAIFNFGTKMRLDGRILFINEEPLNEPGGPTEIPAQYRTEKYDMPLGLRFGLAWKAVKNEHMEITMAVDGTQPNDNTEYLNSGIEIGLERMLYLRAGYKSLFLENSEQGLTFGVGFRYDAVGSNFKFDFGWADYGRLQSVKFVSFAIRY